MTVSDQASSLAQRALRRKTRLIVGLVVAAAALLLVLANFHLVYVATTSQPECIAHLKTSGAASGSFRAAKPAC